MMMGSLPVGAESSCNTRMESSTCSTRIEIEVGRLGEGELIREATEEEDGYRDDDDDEEEEEEEEEELGQELDEAVGSEEASIENNGYHHHHHQLLLPPPNFASVDEGVYRSGYPHIRNFPFLHTLRLRSVLYLCPEAYPDPHMEFLRNHGIQLFHYGIQGTKGALLNMPSNVIRQALEVLIDKRNHPILIHCRKGKHRTGCLIGCLRKVQNFPLASIIDEYKHFSGEKARAVDQEFIRMFDVSSIKGSNGPSWICSCSCKCKHHLLRVHPTTYTL